MKEEQQPRGKSKLSVDIREGTVRKLNEDLTGYMNNKHEPETAALLVQDQNSSASPNHRRQLNIVHNASSFNQ